MAAGFLFLRVHLHVACRTHTGDPGAEAAVEEEAAEAAQLLGPLGLWLIVIGPPWAKAGGSSLGGFQYE